MRCLAFFQLCSHTRRASRHTACLPSTQRLCAFTDAACSTISHDNLILPRLWRGGLLLATMGGTAIRLGVNNTKTACELRHTATHRHPSCLAVTSTTLARRGRPRPLIESARRAPVFGARSSRRLRFRCCLRLCVGTGCNYSDQVFIAQRSSFVHDPLALPVFVADLPLDRFLLVGEVAALLLQQLDSVPRGVCHRAEEHEGGSWVDGHAAARRRCRRRPSCCWCWCRCCCCRWCWCWYGCCCCCCCAACLCHHSALLVPRLACVGRAEC